MVDLDQLECKDCYAFEKDKVYCVKINFDHFVPGEMIKSWCEGLKEKFKENSIDLIVVPLTNGGPICDIEFFTINENEKEEIKE